MGAANLNRIAASLAAELARAAQPQPDVIPHGWFNAEQWREAWGCCRTSAKDRLGLLVDRGLMERRKFRTIHDGKAHLTSFYKAR
jgi:hypothetical protein